MQEKGGIVFHLHLSPCCLAFEWSLVTTKRTCRPLLWVVLTKAGTWTLDETCIAESAGSGSLDLGAPVTTTLNPGPRRLLRHGKNGRRTCSSGSVSLSTCELFEGRGVWLRFVELSDRPTSLVYRVAVTAPNQRRTHQFTLPGRINSKFTAFRGGKDLCGHPSTQGLRLP